jgi:hypothetical protein
MDMATERIATKISHDAGSPSASRMEQYERYLAGLSVELHDYYRFATFGEAQADFIGPVWLSQAPEDAQRHRLTRR